MLMVVKVVILRMRVINLWVDLVEGLGLMDLVGLEVVVVVDTPAVDLAGIPMVLDMAEVVDHMLILYPTTIKMRVQMKWAVVAGNVNIGEPHCGSFEQDADAYSSSPYIVVVGHLVILYVSHDLDVKDEKKVVYLSVV